MIEYNTSFKQVGAAYDESIILLEELYLKKIWSAVQEAVFNENLLKKKSSAWIEKILRYFQIRYLYKRQPLPDSDQLSKYISKMKTRSSKVQVLYQYICSADPLVDRLVVELVGLNLEKYHVLRLTKSSFEDFLQSEAQSNPEINTWATYTREKLRRDFFAFLRTSELMEKAPSVIVKKFIVRPEVFSYFLYGLLDEGYTTKEFFNSSIWRRYFLSRNDLEQLLSQCEVKGWIQFRGYGDVYELVPKHDSLDGWLDSLE